MKTLTLILTLLTLTTAAQVPQLQSLAGAPNTVFIDFDGAIVNNPNWYASPIQAEAAPFTPEQITQCFWRIAEKYTPFNVNITTIEQVWMNKPVTNRMRCIITPTSSWYGSSGGVAFVGSFGYAAYEPCWVFTNMTGNSPKYAADAAAHEIGHTLSLNHHGQYNVNCERVNPYHPGKGSGDTYWGPIMGAPYNANITQWYNGPTTQTCNGVIVDDLKQMTTYTTAVKYKTDDRANDMQGALPIGRYNQSVSDSGVIETTGDVDMFKFTTSAPFNVTLTMKPATLSPMLHCKIELINAAGQVLIIDTSLAKLSATVSMTDLAPGTYFIRASGSGNPNYIDYGSTQPTNYGSLGRYWITGTIAERTVTVCPKPLFTTVSECRGVVLTVIPNSAYTTLTAGYSYDGVNYIWQNVANNTTLYQLNKGDVYFEVKAVCGTLQAASGAQVYNVNVVKLPPPNYTLTSDKKKQMQINIENNNAIRWQVRIKQQETNAWQWTFNTTSTQINRGNLLSGKMYEVQIKSVCSSGQGDWSTSKTVTIK